MPSTPDSRARLRLAGQADLGIWVEAATGSDLWSIQRRIASAASAYRARVAVPSCTASGKTWLAARLALAFFDAYTPETPCRRCGGSCGGAKVITLASKFEHLRDVLWGEIRTAYTQLQDRGIRFDGRMGIGQTLRLDAGPDHWILGQSPSQAESLQGVHGAHILVIGDEATALPEETTRGLVSSLATGDARQLLIFNPTSADTWAHEQCARGDVIRVKAWDTPLFTGEPPPPGAYLLTPEYLDEMRAVGMGPGTYDWETKIEAEFWDLSDDNLIGEAWYDAACASSGYEGSRALGIDLAAYGSNENVIAYRNGNIVERVDAFPAMRPDTFFEGPVTEAITRFAPDFVIYDADGVGAGVIGYAEAAVKSAMRINPEHIIQLVPFRGALNVQTKFQNWRSQAWWNLRRRFENHAIAVRPHDLKLREQVTKLKYTITANGDIRVETKEELRRRDRGFTLDRGDALCYAFAMVEELIPVKDDSAPLSEYFGLKDRSEAAMKKRDREQMEGHIKLDETWI